jgi:predicted ester cyclase
MGATTTARTPIETAREAFAVLNRRDADALRAFWAHDVVEVFPYGTVRGQDAVRDAFAETFAAIPDFHIEAEHVAAEGEVVFVKWRITGTFTGAAWQGIEPTGSAIDLHGMDCFTIRDGLVVHNHVVFDQLEFARQIGMLPRAGTRADRATTQAFNAATRLRRRLRRA